MRVVLELSLPCVSLSAATRCVDGPRLLISILSGKPSVVLSAHRVFIVDARRMVLVHCTDASHAIRSGLERTVRVLSCVPCGLRGRLTVQLATTARLRIRMVRQAAAARRWLVKRSISVRVRLFRVRLFRVRLRVRLASTPTAFILSSPVLRTSLSSRRCSVKSFLRSFLSCFVS